MSEPEFYEDLVYNFRKKKFDGMIFSDKSRKIIIRYKRTWYSMNVMRHTACLVVNPVTVKTLLPSLIARRRVGSQTKWRQFSIKLVWGLGPTRVHLLDFCAFECWSCCWVLINFISLVCRILIYMFANLMHGWVWSASRGPNNWYV